MQGLAHYADSPSPPPEAGPSRLQAQPVAPGPSPSPISSTTRGNGAAGPSKGATSSTEAKIESASNGSSRQSNAGPRTGSKGKRRAPEPTENARTEPIDDKEPHAPADTAPRSTSLRKIPEPAAEVEDARTERKTPPLSEEEQLRQFLRPPDMDVPDWGIPPPVDPSQCSETLKAKVENFLRIKYERNQHINTTLLSSSAFANPHIYAKLVEFVSIDETATAFPGTGWLTRKDIKDLIPTYGPDAMNAVQKAKLAATRRAQEAGKRSTIAFTTGKKSDRPSGGPDEGRWDKEGRGGYRSEGKRDRDRDRERDRDRDRNRNGGKKRYRDSYVSDRDYRDDAGDRSRGSHSRL